MQSLTLNAIFLIAACTLSTGATAQNIYKCGNSYSQAPCPGGVVLDTTDQRSNAQKMQTDLATTRDAKVADAMETNRLQKEKTYLAANTPLLNPTSADLTNFDLANGGNAPRQAKNKAPAHFTAQVPGEKKKKQSVKKKAKKKKISTS